MRGYLLDNNHIGAFVRQEPNVLQKLRTVPAEHLLFVCRITLGEIEAGHRGMTQTTNQVRRDEYDAYIEENLFSVEVSESTSDCYGEIMGRIWQKHPPPSGKKTERHLVDLGVDINDVWTVAIAWEHGLTVLTDDKMTCIREVVEESGEVQFDCWIRNRRN